MGGVRGAEHRMRRIAKAIAPEALVVAVERYGVVERTVVCRGPAYLAKIKAI
jgi:hypothetical protein